MCVCVCVCVCVFFRRASLPPTFFLFRMAHNLRIHILRYLIRETDCHVDDAPRLEAWQIPQNRIRTAQRKTISQHAPLRNHPFASRQSVPIDKGTNLPRTPQYIPSDEDELRNDAQDVEMRSIREQKIPQQ